jgi:hypothetical protein
LGETYSRNKNKAVLVRTIQQPERRHQATVRSLYQLTQPKNKHLNYTIGILEKAKRFLANSVNPLQYNTLDD